jgi:hypothetical protein
MQRRFLGLRTQALLAIAPLLLGLSHGVATADTPCDNQTKPGVNCACDLRTLRPLQGAVGMEEVRDKAKKIAKKTEKELRDLSSDPIKVIRGPGDSLFITDHHHGARAWLLADHPMAICRIEAGPQFGDEAQFWSQLEIAHLAHLADENGKPITPDALPRSVQQLPDDPYRSLAWLVRKDDGFCRALMPQKEFAEFQWADWLRTKPEVPVSSVKASPESLLPVALTLVKSPAAAALPGYRGDKPESFLCPKEE